MSTRCTVHFGDGSGTPPTAIIYRHTDGYPSETGEDLQKFLKACQKLPDNRLDDPSYLAAKYVVWLARQFNHNWTFVGDELKKTKNKSPLDFLSVGVLSEDPGDIEFRYTVQCGHWTEDRLPEVKCESVRSPVSKPCKV